MFIFTICKINIRNMYFMNIYNFHMPNYYFIGSAFNSKQVNKLKLMKELIVNIIHTFQKQ